MKEIEIVLKLHCYPEYSAYLLSYGDVEDYSNKNGAIDSKLSVYLSCLIEYENYSLIKNTELAFFDDSYKEYSRGWLYGYDYALKHNISSKDGEITIVGKGYRIIYKKPFKA